MEKQIKKFKEETGISLEIKDGRPYYDGDLNLRNTDLTVLPDNLTVNGCLWLYDANIKSLPDNLTVHGNLDVRNTDIASIPNDLIVYGALWLNNSKVTSLPDNFTVGSLGGKSALLDIDITSLPENLTVGGDLFLSHTKITSLSNNLTVGGCLNLMDSKVTTLPENLIVGGNLVLCETNILSLPENLIVGGGLYVRDTKITSLPDKFTVGGDLDLRCCHIASLSDNLIVGRDLSIDDSDITSLPNDLIVGRNFEFRDTNIADITELPDTLTVGGSLLRNAIRINTPKVNRNLNEDLVDKIWRGKKYICADGIFTEVLSHKGNVWHVRKIGGIKSFYLVTDGNGNYAHGNTIKKAKEELIYKITKRDESEYRSLQPDSVLPFAKSIECYREITGACTFSTKYFVEKELQEKDRKDSYTIAEIAKLTEGQYGNSTFKEFFKIKD